METRHSEEKFRSAWACSGPGVRTLPSPSTRWGGQFPSPSAGRGVGWAQGACQGLQGHPPCPSAKAQQREEEGRLSEGGESSITPPQALIETINQTQKYYARPGVRERWLVAMATPEPASPMVGGGGNR